MTSRSSSASVAQSLIARVSVLGVNVLTGMIVARALAPTGRGEQAAITLWPTFLAGLLTLGVPSAIRFQARRRPDVASQIFSTALVLLGSLSIIAIVIGLVVIPHWLAKYPPVIILFAQITLVFVPNVFGGFILQAMLESRGDFIRSNQLFALAPLFTLLCLLMLLVTHRLTPITSSLAYLAPSLVINLRMAFLMRHLFATGLKHFKKTAAALLSYGIASYGIDLLGTLSGTVDSALVVGFLTSRTLGLYTVALAASRLLNVVAISINGVIFPKASGMQQQDALRVVGRAVRVGFAASLAGGALFIGALPLLLPLLYGHLYGPVVGVAQVLTVEAIVGSTIATYGQGFMATGRPFAVTIFQLAGLCATVPLMLVLIPRLGLMGAAISLLASTLIRFVCVALAYPALLKIPAPSLILTKGDIAFLRARLRSR